MIVSSAALRDKRPASALTYVEIVCLTRTDLEKELVSYPVSRHHIHVAAVNFGARRHTHSPNVSHTSTLLSNSSTLKL